MLERYHIANELVDEDKEKALLASLVAQPSKFFEVTDFLTPDVFTAERQETYQNIEYAIAEGKPLPAVESAEACNDIETVAKDLAELYQKRLIAISAENLYHELHEKTSKDIINGLESSLVEIQQAVKELSSGSVYSVKDLMPNVIEDVQSRINARQVKGAAAIGLGTGIKKIDTLLGGLQTGIHLMAAEPGTGKTTLTLQIAGHIAKNGYPVLFLSFEESKDRLALKSICQAASIAMKKYNDGLGDIAELKKAIQEHSYKLAPLYIIEGNAKLTTASVKAKALQIMNKHKTEKCLIIVDYLQQWASTRREFTDFRHIVSGLVAELRELSFRLNSPVLVISSQNRGGQGKADLTSLKESGDLEYSADSAMFLVEDTNRTPTPPARAVNIQLEKNRYGDKGKAEMIFRPDIGTFGEEEKKLDRGIK